MRNYIFSRAYIRMLLLVLATMTFSSHAVAALAAKVEFALGNVTATRLNGQSRVLNKGAELNTGDSISTGDGRLQIRFTDGAYLSLQPNTVFKIETYAFANKVDGNEKAFFSLLKGGLRTITGAIGKVNQKNYEMRTTTATIGIRGTAYSANQSGEGLTVAVSEGAVAVSNQAGVLAVSAGQSAFVRSPQSMPQVLTGAASLPQLEAPQIQTEQQTTGPSGPSIIFNEQVNESGHPSVLNSAPFNGPLQPEFPPEEPMQPEFPPP